MECFPPSSGDSRGVLCRKDGVAFALSEDHKPQQDIEKNRIVGAGGFVNAVGRINGNLNLSRYVTLLCVVLFLHHKYFILISSVRSLGDLKYKQLYHLPPDKQVCFQYLYGVYYYQLLSFVDNYSRT